MCNVFLAAKRNYYREQKDNIITYLRVVLQYHNTLTRVRLCD